MEADQIIISLLSLTGQLQLAIYLNSGLLTIHVQSARYLKSTNARPCNSYVKVNIARRWLILFAGKWRLYHPTFCGPSRAGFTHPGWSRTDILSNDFGQKR